MATEWQKVSEYPLISIITAVRNGAPYLRELIESVLQQDYPNFEHIVIDDGSNDDGATVAILRSYRHLRWWSRENKGQYATQNEGIVASRGRFVGVISADDTYVTPNAFSDVFRYWQSHPKCDVIYGKTLRVDRAGKAMPYQLDITGRYPRWLLRHYLYVQHCSLFVARDLVVDHEIWFDPSLNYAGDWDWIIRLFDASAQIGYLAEPLSIWRMHEGQTSRTAPSEAVAREHRRVCQTYGASYRIHVVLQQLVNHLAMTVIAIATLRNDGPNELGRLAKDWLRRRQKRQRS